MAEKPPPPAKGRGATLLALLKQARESKPGDAPAESPAAPEPPKPRGLSARLEKLAQLKAKRVGGDGDGPSTSAPKSPSSTAVETKSPPSTTAVEKKLEEVRLESGEPVCYRGETGTQIHVTANYIRMRVERDRGVFEYDVRYDPEVDNKSMRIKILNMHMGEMGKIRMFDGGSLLYLPVKLPDVVNVFKCKHPLSDDEVTMKVTYKKQKRLGECLHLYNVLFKRIMHALLYSRFGRNYFSPEHTQMIPQHKLEILPGYAIAVDEYEGGIMLCLDIQHRVLRCQNVLELFREYRTRFQSDFKDATTKQVIGSSVLTRYNNKTYVIDEIMWNATPKDTFDTFDGRKISYLEYYKKQHDITVADINQPLLLNRRAVRQAGTLEKVDQFICLVPELCYMTGMSDEMRSDMKVMKDVAQYTRITPSQRMNSLRKFMENVAHNEKAQQILKDWGLELDKATIDLHARVIDPETIVFGAGVSYRCNEKADWNGPVSKHKVLGPIDFLNWVVFYIQKDERIAREFAQNMRRLADVMGNEIREPRMYCLKDDRTDTYFAACKDVIRPDVQILVFLLPTLRSDRYSTIKKLACAEMPIPSQCVLTRTLQNQQKVRTITQKIAQQMNNKLGGSTWLLRFPFRNWMICGIDVYHSKGNKSVCAFVASVNESVTKWYSEAVFQDREISDHLKKCFMNALAKFRENTGSFPQKIVIFRDGVGDGQLQHCKEYEIPQFESCVRQFNLTDCTITFVVVQKRINTRIFTKTRGALENPTPGTVLDNTVTRRYMYDFFLVSQLVRQGTVTPTHYIVLQDKGNIKPDHLQRLAYKLCHLYYNWAGTIRVPAPCQYAHKLAALIGQYVGKTPAPELSDKLYFL